MFYSKTMLACILKETTNGFSHLSFKTSLRLRIVYRKVYRIKEKEEKRCSEEAARQNGRRW